jgi:hypothetical protein
MLVAGTFSGRGKLSPGDMEVNYELARDAVTRTSRSGLPSIVSWNSTLKLQRVDGQPLQEGIFELTMADGTTERVKNHGFQWSVLSPLP